MKPFKMLYLIFMIFLLSGFTVFGELLSNPDFESGITDWTGRGCDIAAETTEVHTGSGAVYVFGRDRSWKGLQQDVTSILQAGGSGHDYTYSAWVKMATNGTHEARLRLRVVSDSGTDLNEYRLDATSSGWTQLSNVQTITWSGTLSSASFEVINSTADATYYVDDCSLTSSTANNPPTFNTNPITKPGAMTGQPYLGQTLDGSASDVDVGDTLSYYNDTPGWLSVATDGTLSGTPSTPDVGLNQFTVRVEDGNGGSDTATLEINVFAGPTAPAFDDNPVIGNSAVVDMPYSSTLAHVTSDANGDTITFALISTPSWLSVASDGALSGTPTFADLGEEEFIIEVQDDGGLSSTGSLFIAVVEGNNLPYADSFETQSRWTTSWLLPGWSSYEWAAPQIRAATNNYAGSLPITGLRHEQILDVNGPVENTFFSALSNATILVDALVQPSLRTNPAHPTTSPSSQLSFYFNDSGKMVVLHAVYSNAFSTVSRQWTTLDNTTVTNGQWVRLKITSDYLSDSLRNDKYFSIELDGTTMTNPAAYTITSPTDEVAHMGGSLFLCADSGNGGGNAALTGMAMDGVMRVDDLTITTPSSLTAQGTPLEWIEFYYPGSDPATVDLLDTDGDGMTTWQEFLAGTDPTDAGSALITSIAQNGDDIEITWPSAFSGPLTPYAVYCSTNLLDPGGGWELVEGNILRDLSGINQWVNPSPPDAPAVFYRPAVQNP